VTTDSNPADPAALRSALLSGVARSWEELQEAVRGLDDRQLAAPGPDAWSIKDHMAHLAHWERYLVASIEGRDQMAALGLPPDQERSETAINEALQRLDAGRSPEEARHLLLEAHAETVACLEGLDDADLERHRRLIEGNTSGHFDEHRGWIGGLAAAVS
jgi:uncharacterized damage-inducible protein DinB